MPTPRPDDSYAPVPEYKVYYRTAGAPAGDRAEPGQKDSVLGEPAAFDARSAAEALEAATEQASRATVAALEVMEQAAPDPAAVGRASEAVASHMRDLSTEWLQTFREQTAKNLEGVARLAACRSPMDFLRLHTELTREGLSDSVALTRRINSASLRALGAIAEDSADATRPPAP